METDDITILMDFSRPEAVEGWEAIDDRVMGGVSRSRLEVLPDGTAAFRGSVSFEDGGGFASVRSAPVRLDLHGFRGLALRVLGDGKTYKLNVRTDTRFDGITYQTAFEAPRGAWTTVRLPLSGLVPRFRGRDVRDAPPLDPRRIVTLGLLISDRQEGPFELRMAWIGAWR